MPSALRTFKLSLCLMTVLLATACGKLQVNPQEETSEARGFMSTTNCHSDKDMQFYFWGPHFPRFTEIKARGYVLDREAMRNLCIRARGNYRTAYDILGAYLDHRVFNPHHYAHLRPDVVRAMGWGRLLSHYLTYGIKPGGSRVGGGSECTSIAPGFNECAYRARNPDVVRAIGPDQLNLHYLQYGMAERRPANW